MTKLTAKPKRARTVTVELPKFRGGSLQLLTCHDHEAILCGPSDTSKTWAGCVKDFLLCSDARRPKAHGIMVRKLFNSINDSCARTFNTITAGLPIKRYGGEKFTEKWVFPNGSELVCAGLDKADKLLSSEWDFAHMVQAEQLTEAEWEMVAGRVTGRGAVVAWPQVFGDCNPAGASHWIRSRASLTRLLSTHKDNPALYDDAGNITAEGRRRIGLLESTLTGVRRKRLLEGQWATAEGAVYDNFDSTPGGPHVRVRDHKEMRRWFLALDEGYTNPAVVLLVGADGDGRLHCFRCFFRRGVLQADVVARARLWFQNPAGYAALPPDGEGVTVLPPAETRCEVAVVDEAAAGLIADLNNAGVYAIGAKGRVLDGCDLVRNALKVAGDGRARYSTDPSCVDHVNEFESYVWNDKAAKDAPKKENDHSMDALRYLFDHLHAGTGAFSGLGELRSAGGGAERFSAGERFKVERVT